jgi:hypothetical protein
MPLNIAVGMISSSAEESRGAGSDAAHAISGRAPRKLLLTRETRLFRSITRAAGKPNVNARQLDR